MEALGITVLLFIGVIAVTALVFGVWLVAGVIRMVAAGVNALFPPPRNPSRAGAGAVVLPPWLVRCVRSRCHADNPAGARFCRRCGAGLAAGATAMPPARRRATARQEVPGDAERTAATARQRVTL